MSKKNKKTKKKMDKAKKNCSYFCDACGCEVTCKKPSESPLKCCDQIMHYW